MRERLELAKVEAARKREEKRLTEEIMRKKEEIDGLDKNIDLKKTNVEEMMLKEEFEQAEKVLIEMEALENELRTCREQLEELEKQLKANETSIIAKSPLDSDAEESQKQESCDQVSISDATETDNTDRATCDSSVNKERHSCADKELTKDKNVSSVNVEPTTIELPAPVEKKCLDSLKADTIKDQQKAQIDILTSANAEMEKQLKTALSANLTKVDDDTSSRTSSIRESSHSRPSNNSTPELNNESVKCENNDVEREPSDKCKNMFMKGVKLRPVNNQNETTKRNSVNATAMKVMNFERNSQNSEHSS